MPLPAPLDDPLLDLHALLAAVQGRMQAVEPSIERIAFLMLDPGSGLLRTVLCHDPRHPGRCFEAGGLASLPALEGLRIRREARVIDDLASDPACVTPHDRWQLEQGWRSSLTLPLLRRDRLLGFLFVHAGRAAAFGPETLEPLQPLLDLLLLRIADHLDSLADLHATLALLAEMVALRDPSTGTHLQRVAAYSALIATQLAGQLPLPEGFAERLALYAPLHDVGKVGIPDRVLLKPAMLDPQEQRLMRSHVLIGMALIERLLEALHLCRDPAVQLLREVVAHHHECLDGSGYPRGLQGTEVSLAGRIVAVADIYDSLTQVRPYKPALDDAHSSAILRGMVESGRLDGRCVEALLSQREARERIRSGRQGGDAAAVS